MRLAFSLTLEDLAERQQANAAIARRITFACALLSGVAAVACAGMGWIGPLFLALLSTLLFALIRVKQIGREGYREQVRTMVEQRPRFRLPSNVELSLVEDGVRWQEAADHYSVLPWSQVLPTRDTGEVLELGRTGLAIPLRVFADGQQALFERALHPPPPHASWTGRPMPEGPWRYTWTPSFALNQRWLAVRYESGELEGGWVARGIGWVFGWIGWRIQLFRHPELVGDFTASFDEQGIAWSGPLSAAVVPWRSVQQVQTGAGLVWAELVWGVHLVAPVPQSDCETLEPLLEKWHEAALEADPIAEESAPSPGPLRPANDSDNPFEAPEVTGEVAGATSWRTTLFWVVVLAIIVLILLANP